LVASQIDMASTDPIAALSQVRAGTIKAYGVTTKTRLLSAPDIPTLDEAGLPGFDVSQWHGLWLPKGASKNITTRLNAAVTDALADLSMRARLSELAQEIFPRARQTPEALGARSRSGGQSSRRRTSSDALVTVGGNRENCNSQCCKGVSVGASL
jgi:tripartite-type tricarboxylate transporter receptor subunit TctC